MEDDPDLQALHSDLEELVSLLDSRQSMPGRAFEATTDADSVTAAIDATRARTDPARETITTALDQISRTDSSPDESACVIRALTAVGTLDAAVNHIAATGSTAVSGSGLSVQPTGPLAVFIGKLKSILDKIQSGILNFLSKYMTFQSWSVAGQLTGGVPWMSGSATLTLTLA